MRVTSRPGRAALVVGPALAALLLAAWVPLAAAQDLTTDDTELEPTETSTEEPLPEPTVDDGTLTEEATGTVEDTTTTVDDTVDTVEDTLADEPTEEPTEEPKEQPKDPGEGADGDDGQDQDTTGDGSGDADGTGGEGSRGDGVGTEADAPRDPSSRGTGQRAPDHLADVLPLRWPLPPSSTSASGPRSTHDIVDALEARGASDIDIIRALAPFPVAGRARYSDDWHAPRGTPSFHLHEGVDVFADRGTPVVAVASGTIDRIRMGTAIGGNTVWLAADDGTEYYYAHLDRVVASLDVGDHVGVGEVLGAVGNTGNAATTPPHLHFQVHPGGGAPVPPVPLLDTWLAEIRDRLGLDASGAVPSLEAVSQPSAGTPPMPPLDLEQPLVAPPLPSWLPDGGIGTAAAAAEETSTGGIGVASTVPAAAPGDDGGSGGQLVAFGMVAVAATLLHARGRRRVRGRGGFVRDDAFRALPSVEPPAMPDWTRPPPWREATPVGS